MSKIDELSDKFDLLIGSYNDSNHLALAFDEYQKSLFFTHAMEAVLQKYYDTYELNERSKEALSTLLTEKVIDLSSISPDKKKYNRVDYSYNVNLDDSIEDFNTNCMFIVEEKASFSDIAPICVQEGNPVGVQPISHDECTSICNNPFRSVNKRRVLRIVADSKDMENHFDILSSYPLKEYKIYYIRKPKPIIFADLDNNLYISGQNKKSESIELGEAVLSEILELASSYAIETLKR